MCKSLLGLRSGNVHEALKHTVRSKILLSSPQRSAPAKACLSIVLFSRSSPDISPRHTISILAPSIPSHEGPGGPLSLLLTFFLKSLVGEVCQNERPISYGQPNLVTTCSHINLRVVVRTPNRRVTHNSGLCADQASVLTTVGLPPVSISPIFSAFL